MLIRKVYSPDEEAATKAAETSKSEKGDQKPADDTVALAKALKEARENSVSKEEFEALREENRRLVSEVINGVGSSDNGQEPSPEQPADISELREKLYGSKCSELTNLEFWENTLKLRGEVMKKGDPDPFLPIGSKITPDQNDVEAAQRVADVVQQCIDEADGNSEVFTALLQSRTNNDSTAMTMHLKKLGIKYK